MRTRIPTLLLATLALASASGCVYYNTFYHAKTAAREAELLREARSLDSDPSVREMSLLERVVEKSGRVLRLHPDSQWADDALLLLGTALYHQGKLESAEERLTEFLALYPDSELVPDARYVLAAVLLDAGNPVSAEELLSRLAYADPPHRLSDDALAMIGDARRARGQHAAAAEAYLDALQRFPRGDRRGRIRFAAAENYVDMGRPEEAVVHYAAVAGEEGARQFLFEARMRLAEAYLSLGDARAALEVLRDLEARAILDEDLDRVLLLAGRAHEVMGDPDRAVSTYEEIAASRDRTPAAAEAHYRVGLIRRDLYGDLDAAAQSFETSRRQAPRSDVAKLAISALDDLGTLRECLAVISDHERSLSDTTTASAAPADTASVAQQGDSRAAPADSAAAACTDVAAARLRAAEIYLFQLDDVTRALKHYRSVLEMHPESEVAPKAALAIAWILEHRLDDPAGAAEAYRRVAEDFPGSEYATEAERSLARLDKELPPDPGPLQMEEQEGEGRQ